MPAINILTRRGASKTPSLNPVYIAGFCVVGVVAVGLATWFLVRFFRKRAAAKREDARGTAFLSVRGIVRAGDIEKQHSPQNPKQGAVGTFSRDRLTPSIVLPEKTLALPTLRTREEIINFHRQSGTFPQPFSPKPFSFALAAGIIPPTLSPAGPDRSSTFRNSMLSVTSSHSRFSVMSSNSSFDRSPTSGTARKVRQIFSPVLPDELVIARLGEQLNVVQSFDDGWCLVGRDTGTFISSAKSLFKTNPTPETNVELGVVPAWCFLKAVKGLKAERPVRSSSLGITVQINDHGFSSRDEVISWSNF